MHDVLRRTGELIDQREQGDALKRAEYLIKALAKLEPHNDMVWGRLCHIFYYKGFFSDTLELQRRYYELAVQYGQRAIELYPQGTYGNFWYAMALEVNRKTTRTKWLPFWFSFHAAKEVDRHAQIVLMQNERYFFAGPHRLIGHVIDETFGLYWTGRRKKALSHLERSVDMAPGFLANRLFLAQAFLANKLSLRAREQLEWIIDAPLHPDHRREDSRHKEEAQSLLITI